MGTLYTTPKTQGLVQEKQLKGSKRVSSEYCRTTKHIHRQRL